jgi:hypothetical protein
MEVSYTEKAIGSKNIINVLNVEAIILKFKGQFKSTKNLFCERRCIDCKAVTFGAEFPVEDGKKDYIF